MKSALEIAMEKTAAAGEEARRELAKLTPEQREEIENIKKTYEGKIAEQEVMFQQEAMKVTGGAPLDYASYLQPEQQAALDDLRQKRREDRESMEAERDKKIEEAKKG